MDRLARNAEDLLRLVRELTGEACRLSFVKTTDVLREGDPMGQAHVTMLRVREFVRELSANAARRHRHCIAKGVNRVEEALQRQCRAR
jgi:hypothetical protein